MNHSDEEKILQDSLIRIKELKKELYTIKQEPIAIIGLGCRFPGGADNPAAYWQLLKNHQNAVTEIPKNRWDVDAYYSADNSSVGKSYARHGAFLKDGVDKFDPLFFNISPIEAPMIDPRQRLLLEVVWESLEDANLVPEEIKNSSTSLFIGISGNEWGELLHEQTDNEAQKAAGISLSMLSGRISHFFGLKGPSVVLDTACSGSLVAVHQACQSLRSGESNLALAGGINLLLSPYGFVISAKANLLSINGCCKTFDQGADGHVRGEGCGIVVLKRLSDAQKNHDRILAVIKGSAVNHDGASGGLMIPNGKVQEELIRTALYNANLQPDDINYLEVQGTASKIGDPIEAKAIYNVFCRKNNDNKRTQPLIIGTVKANIGHTEAAAGIAGLIKTVLALQNEEIPKQLHFEKKNQSIIDFEAIPAQIPINSTAWKRKNGYLRRAGISAFGFSGTNAHVIIEETSSLVEVTQKSSNTSHLLLISAKNSTSLHQQIQNYIVFLKNTDQDIADICYTSQIGRTHFKKRVGIEGLTHEDFVEKLQTINSSLDNLDETNNSSLLKQFMSGENKLAWYEFI